MRIVSRFFLIAALTMGMIAAPGCSLGDDENGNDSTQAIAPSLWQDLLTDVSFRDESVGVVSGWSGKILRTTDGGATWVETNTKTKADLNSVAFLTDNVVVAVGSGGKMLRSTDAGATWTVLDSPTTETLNGIVMTDDGNAVAVGWNATVLTSSDIGSSWTVEELDFPNNYISIDHNQGVTVTVSSGGFVYRSGDGVNWELLSLPEEVTPAAVGMGGFSTAMLVGEYGEMLISNDFGSDWQTSTSVNTADLLCVAYIGDGLNAIAAGWDGIMVRTDDGGFTWTTVASGTTRPIRAIEVVDSLTAYAVGDGDTILVSHDGGYTWERLRGTE